MPMRRVLLAALVSLACGAIYLVRVSFNTPDVPLLYVTEKNVRHEETLGGLCPWRDSKADLAHWFPNAEGTQDQMLVLSRLRTDISRRLGRPMSEEENALRVHRVIRGGKSIGTIVNRCLRGESGVIELTMAVNLSHKILGARIQRLRESDEIANALRFSWIGAFSGETADSPWQIGKDIPPLPASAQVSGKVLIDGARSTLILLDAASRADKRNE